MRRTRRIFTGLICAAMVFSSVAALPVYAEQSRIRVYQCPECLEGAVYDLPDIRKYEHDETFPCSHGLSGVDVYAVYEVTVRKSCNRCSYEYNYSYEDHVLTSCKGH